MKAMHTIREDWLSERPGTIFMIQDQNIRTFLAKFLDNTFEKTQEFSDDIFTTKKVLSMFQQSPTELEIWNITISDFQAFMIESGLEGSTIAGTVEKLWKIKLKG